MERPVIGSWAAPRPFPQRQLSPIMRAEIGKIIRQINALDLSLILVEQNAMLALTLAGYGYVPETDSLVMQGQA